MPDVSEAGTREEGPERPKSRTAESPQHIPQRIGLVMLDPADVAETSGPAPHGTRTPAALLLDDFADALMAYARMAAREAGLGAAAMPELIRLNASSTQHVGETARAYDALVFAMTMPQSSEDAGASGSSVDASQLEIAFKQAASQLQPLDAVATRVYAVVAAYHSDGMDGAPILQSLAQTCARRGLRWSGGLVVTDADLIPRLMRAPRLGAWRRPVSESIDQLVAAVRMKCTVSMVEQLLDDGADKRDEPPASNQDGTGALLASPAPLWRSFARRFNKHAKSND